MERWICNVSILILPLAAPFMTASFEVVFPRPYTFSPAIPTQRSPSSSPPLPTNCSHQPSYLIYLRCIYSVYPFFPYQGAPPTGQARLPLWNRVGHLASSGAQIDESRVIAQATPPLIGRDPPPGIRLAICRFLGFSMALLPLGLGEHKRARWCAGEAIALSQRPQSDWPLSLLSLLAARLSQRYKKR